GVHANEIEGHAHVRIHAAQFQITADWCNAFQTEEDSPAAAAVNELDTAQVEDQIAATLEHRCHRVTKSGNVAGIKFFHINADALHVAKRLNRWLHGMSRADFGFASGEEMGTVPLSLRGQSPFLRHVNDTSTLLILTVAHLIDALANQVQAEAVFAAAVKDRL